MYANNAEGIRIGVTLLLLSSGFYAVWGQRARHLDPAGGRREATTGRHPNRLHRHWYDHNGHGRIFPADRGI
jgi:hypothetical protein